MVAMYSLDPFLVRFVSKDSNHTYEGGESLFGGTAQATGLAWHLVRSLLLCKEDTFRTVFARRPTTQASNTERSGLVSMSSITGNGDEDAEEHRNKDNKHRGDEDDYPACYGKSTCNERFLNAKIARTA